MSAIASSSYTSIKSVVYYNGSTKLGSGTGAYYTYNWANLAVGTYTITALATDDDKLSTTSAPVTFTVIADVPPTVAITDFINEPTTYVYPVTLLVEAANSSSDSTIVSVAFYAGSTKIGTVSTGQNPCLVNWKTPGPGTYALTAVATDAVGISTTSDPVEITIIADPPPVVSIATPASGATFTSPATVALSATATSEYEGIASVAYFNGATKLATETEPPYAYNWKKVAAGSYSITAVATDGLGTQTTSSAVSITVQ